MSFDMAREIAIGELIRSRWWAGFGFGVVWGLGLALMVRWLAG
jgi:hypothetical protein